jgi:hypothetical protein
VQQSQAIATQVVAEGAVDGDIEVPGATRAAERSPATRALFAARGWKDERDALEAHRRAESAAPDRSSATVANLIQAYGDPTTGERKASGDVGGR